MARESVVDRVEAIDDPRVQPAHLRVVPASEGAEPVVIIGVVHDHPASLARARLVTEAADPAVVALEVPPVAVPYYARATGEHPEGTLGGEQRVAVEAAPTAEPVGIDLPSLSILTLLPRYLRANPLAPGTLGRILSQLASTASHALRCRLATAPLVAGLLSTEPDVGTRRDDVADDPTAEAADERREIDRSRSFFAAVEVPPAMAALDDLRERHMARRLARARLRGPVVAVVGHAHLDGLATHLAEA